jgi:hypothetical protein
MKSPILLFLLPVASLARQHPMLVPQTPHPPFNELLSSKPDLSLLNLLFQQNSSVLEHLTSALVQEEEVTFLAPSDDAFRKLLEGHRMPLIPLKRSESRGQGSDFYFSRCPQWRSGQVSYERHPRALHLAVILSYHPRPVQLGRNVLSIAEDYGDVFAKHSFCCGKAWYFEDGKDAWGGVDFWRRRRGDVLA